MFRFYRKQGIKKAARSEESMEELENAKKEDPEIFMTGESREMCNL